VRQIFLDTETTGLDAANGDRLIEIGCLEMVNRRLTGNNLHLYVNPERSSHPDALKVHGITDEFLADKPLFASVADELIRYVAGAEVLIHNASFDVGFLDAELKRVKKPAFAAHAAKVTDTLVMARSMFPGKANSLDALCRRLEVDNTHRTLHGALLDAGLLAEVYVRLTRGQDSLVIEGQTSASNAQTAALAAMDFSAFDLPLVAVSQAEREAHEKVLTEIDKASGGKTVWRSIAAGQA
jgi:DNA polymerase III subunit epsilon